MGAVADYYVELAAPMQRPGWKAASIVRFIGSRRHVLRFVIFRAPLLLSYLVSQAAGEELRC